MTNGAAQSSIVNHRSQLLATRILKLAGWLLTMAVLGVALGAVQLIPLLELLPLNFRDGSATLAQVRGWAWPTPPCAHLPAAQYLWQPQPPPMV